MRRQTLLPFFCGMPLQRRQVWTPVLRWSLLAPDQLNFWCRDGLRQPPGKLVSSSSDMTTVAASSEVNAGIVASRSIPPCSDSLFPSVSMGPPMCEGSGTSGPAGAQPRPHRPSSILGDAGLWVPLASQRDEHC